MKDYKVGDTIAVKAKVIRATNGSEMPYQVSYITGYDNDGLRSGNSFWVTDSEIVETAKPELPKAVADLVKIHKDGYGSLGSFIESVYEPETEVAEWVNAWVYQNSQSDVRYKMLVDAWYNGYTIEQEPRYKVYVTGTNKQYMYVKRGELAKAHNKKATPITPQSIGNYLTAGGNRDLYWFTDEEITKFDLQNCEKELVADDSED